MAPKNGQSMKNTLLMVFVSISVVLILMVWYQGFTGSGAQATPSYYRESFEMDPNVYLTVTAQAIEFEQQLGGTPTPGGEDEHQGSGQGQGRGQGHDAATAVPTPPSEGTRTP